MNARIDHILLPVNDLEASFEFYCDIIGFRRGGLHGPFEMVQISDHAAVLLAEFQTEGGTHLAFSFSESEFHSIFERIKKQDLSFGDRFDRVDNGQGPSPQPGATGEEPGIYLLDPSRHLIELRISNC